MKQLQQYPLLRRLRIAIGLVLIIIFGGGCEAFAPSPTPTLLPTFHARELLLNALSFPKRWVVFPCKPHCDNRERETHAGRNFGIVDVAGHVIQDVFRFTTVEAAQAKFRTYRETTFGTPPSEITYRSPIADEYYLACGVDTVLGCHANIRYGNYFIYFYFDIDDGQRGEGLRFHEVEPILRAMDAQATTVLRIPVSATPPASPP
jgi:hypothetical protein